MLSNFTSFSSSFFIFLFDSWEKGNLNLKCLYLIVENSLMVHFDSIPHHSQYMKTKK